MKETRKKVYLTNNLKLVLTGKMSENGQNCHGHAIYDTCKRKGFCRRWIFLRHDLDADI